MKRFLSALALVSCLIFLYTPASAHAEDREDILIIAHKSVVEDTLSFDEIRLIFLKKKRVWGEGQEITVIHDRATTALRHRFDEKVLGLSVVDEKRYWREEAVRNSLKPPKEIDSKDHARLKAVFATKGAIGYVLRRNYLPNVVKILAVVPAPEAP